jgi:hypothetical protein
MAMSQWMKHSSETDVTKRPCGLKMENFRIGRLKKKSRNVPSFQSFVQTIEMDSNILDEYAAKNEWNFSKISKTNRPSHQRWKK